jgi:hypothetical protein
MASVFLMRRQPNPFAAEGGSEGILQGAEGIRHEADGRWGRKGMQHGAVGQGTGDRGQEVASPSLGSVFQKDGVSVEQTGGKQLAADGGVVRTMPIRTPKRIASWMPRRVRAAVVAQHAAQADGIRHEADGEGGEMERPKDEETKRPKDRRERPRQLAVPYQNYRRYRG